MLEVSKLTRCYGDFVAVDQVSFTIKQGEIVGLLGHNGAGKTTIMKMLSGYLEPNHGRIQINGSDLSDDLKRIQKILGYLPESLPVYSEMTVADYLDYAADLKGLKDTEKHHEIRRVVAATDITAKLSATIATLSRGYKQRVGVAQAILGKPKLLILDEPTNGLDPTQTEHMRELIREIAKQATVILSTHIMQEVDALCDRVLILRDGVLAVDAKLTDLRHSNHLLLTTSMPPKTTTHTTLNSITGIEQVALISDSNTPPFEYRLKIKHTDQADEISAEVANTIIQNQHQLYQLRREQRDLETLFREVNNSNATKNTHQQQEEISHAA